MVTKEKIVYGRDVFYVTSHSELLHDSSRIAEVRKNIQCGDMLIVKNVFDKKIIEQIKKYLTNVGQNSLPSYRNIEVGCPNFHRVNIWDKRSYVQACFHQFVFFPWNQDIFNLFDLVKEVYHVKNLISELPKNKFLSSEPEDGCIARLAFQFYPRGTGAMNKHCDPLDYHQLTVPILVMSKKGEDFVKGGVYVEKTDGEKIILDDIADVGDVIYFNAQTPHGVELIDPGYEIDWTSFQGRWMLLFAVNKLFNNNQIGNSVDLEI
ncbi:MAG: hypothetical protein HY094_09460 [Candidatus Melainabacteria bacterium]|nr:hypothetical protein [Candidatus Melainabacteria bacterium]